MHKPQVKSKIEIHIEGRISLRTMLLGISRSA